MEQEVVLVLMVPLSDLSKVLSVALLVCSKGLVSEALSQVLGMVLVELSEVLPEALSEVLP